MAVGRMDLVARQEAFWRAMLGGGAVADCGPLNPLRRAADDPGDVAAAVGRKLDALFAGD